jgi:hypothetical protein
VGALHLFDSHLLASARIARQDHAAKGALAQLLHKHKLASLIQRGTLSGCGGHRCERMRLLSAAAGAAGPVLSVLLCCCWSLLGAVGCCSAGAAALSKPASASAQR